MISPENWGCPDNSQNVATEMLDPESITFLARPLIPQLLLRHTSKDLSDIYH